ncbi:putative ABC transporter [Polychytrium aggregatum]|uniref:putative ABC transporter n=1 Tax=Polychytrium aggregatum TaxID=110093 RepID=UPI0022FE9313|nr:putative ABC transporter [Polychytrium aggregatum]KAI9193674.1 putative ABC transporter [Polychytrium aggregatum]
MGNAQTHQEPFQGIDPSRPALAQAPTKAHGSSLSQKSPSSIMITVEGGDEHPTRASESIIELRNIHKTYLLGVEGVAALRGVDLTIYKGEWVMIYGTSGGGKTSLLNLIGTIDAPTKGDLRICGTSIREETRDHVLADLRLNKLGFVFQSFNLLSSMTALENVELPMMLKGEIKAAEQRTRAKASLENVGLGHRINHFTNKLSGGEQQRVTIARAIANHPEVLLLDEPTGDLDSKNTQRIMYLLHRLNEQQDMTLVMVTHDPNLKNFGHRIVYMVDGKVHRIEHIPEARRQEKIKELMAFQRGLDQPAEKMPSLEPQAPESPKKKIFEVRQPRDYATYSPSTGIPPILA